jgi:glycosyltransferase involved in cell wall biosynthesis
MNKNQIEILIPTYNEEENISLVIKELNTEGFFNITILDANSKDKTVEIARSSGCRIILDEVSISGFGGSIINGLNNLNNEYFCIFDGDNSFNPKDISLMINKMENGADFVFGTRYLNGAKSEDDTLVSKTGNFFFTLLVNLLFKIKTTDILFFYVLGKKNNIQKLNLERQDFTICAEFLIKAYKNFNCKEVLSVERKRLFGHSKVNRIVDGFKILINILSLYFKK